MEKKKNCLRINGSQWLPIDKCVMTADIKAVHCDTRDFCCLLSEAEPNLSEKLMKISNDSRYTIEPDNVFSFLKKVETLSGGKSSWRVISTPNSSWLKYIRFFRVGDKFVVTDRDGITPLVVDSLNAENLKTVNI